MSTAQLWSAVRCPACAYVEPLAMSMNACLVFHACAGCGAIVRPRAGDCCVFCSDGSVACPPVQAGGTPGPCRSPGLALRQEPDDRTAPGIALLSTDETP